MSHKFPTVSRHAGEWLVLAKYADCGLVLSTRNGAQWTTELVVEQVLYDKERAAARTRAWADRLKQAGVYIYPLKLWRPSPGAETLIYSVALGEKPVTALLKATGRRYTHQEVAEAMDRLIRLGVVQERNGQLSVPVSDKILDALMGEVERKNNMRFSLRGLFT